jgi:hypothetical protein
VSTPDGKILFEKGNSRPELGAFSKGSPSPTQPSGARSHPSANELIEKAFLPFTQAKLNEEERKRKEQELKLTKGKERSTGMDIDF